MWSTEKSPYITLAKITIPEQQFDSEAQNEYGNNLSFNPWHSIIEHMPLGGINRARRVIYETLSTFRHNEDSKKMAEPSEMVNFD